MSVEMIPFAKVHVHLKNGTQRCFNMKDQEQLDSH